MAYKITKYNGKHKIKDVKTGKSVDIDIEKYMKGGYKSVSEYALGGEEKCPPGDWDCIKRERNRIGPPSIDSSLQEVAVPSNKILNEEIKPLTELQSEEELTNNLNLEREEKEMLGDQKFINSNSFKSSQDSLENNRLKEENNLNNYLNTLGDKEFSSINSEVPETDDIYTIPNPYAGVDIPTAAFTLGQSIKNKSTLGIVGSGLKLATGLGRNLVSGLGHANRQNQVMQDYYKDQKNSKNPVQYLAYGGKKDEELATGEFMHGISNENTEEYNAEVESGEYLQTNKGDIAEVVGDKHSQGGEKIKMETNDRVLSDKLKLGAKLAKELSEKYDIKLKSKNTYADVLDKYKRKSKLHKIIEEEAEILKKVGEQEKVKDATTRDLNLQILTKKREEVLSRKHPIEEERKIIFEELFKAQEKSKPKEKSSKDKFEYGGNFEALAKEFNIPLERAKEIIQNFKNGGEKIGNAKKDIREGQSRTEKGFFGNVTPEEYEKFVKKNSSWFNFDNFNPSNPEDVKKLQTRYNQLTPGNKVKEDGLFGEQTVSLSLTETPKSTIAPVDLIRSEKIEPLKLKTPSYVIEEPKDIEVNEPVKNKGELSGAYLFPDENPLPPSSLQGTIKPERRFDRVTPTEIEVEPYLQSIKNREQNQIKNLEGLSPNVRAAILSNVRANSQQAESDVRNKIDTQNLSSEERAIYTNAQIQAREENASEADRLAYEQRQYRAQALTDNDLNNYYNQLQSINKQRFMDIHNLNLINSTNEDVYFDGQSYKRKTSDRDILRQVKV